VRSQLLRLSSRDNGGDRGFTLIELMIAMFIIGGVLLSLVTLQTKAMVSIAQAKERQQATAVANQVLEEMRALPWKTVSAGSPQSAIGADPYISEGFLSFSGEESISGTVVTKEKLSDPNPKPDPVIGSPLYSEDETNATVNKDPETEREFLARAYVTSNDGDDTLQLVAIVEWTPNGEDTTKTVVATSTIFNTENGCGSSSTQPYATACQDHFTAEASVNGPAISVTTTTTETDEDSQQTADLLGDGSHQAIGYGAASTGTTVESTQSTKLRSNGQHSSATKQDLDGENTLDHDADTANASASDSVSSSEPRNDDDATSSVSLPEVSVAGADAKLVLRGGKQNASTSANTTTGCDSIAAGGQPCATGSVTDSGSSLTLDVGGDSITLAEVKATSLNSHVARFPGGTPAGTYCDLVTGSGCVSAQASLGDVTATFPNEIGKVSQKLSADTARGDGVTDGHMSVDRSGSITAPWGDVPSNALNYGDNLRIRPDATDEPGEPGEDDDDEEDDPLDDGDSIVVYENGSVTLTAAPEITIDRLATTAEEDDSECQSQTCSARASSSDVTVRVKYTLTSSTESSAFYVTTTLGSVRAYSSFQAAPEAWADD